MPLETSPYDPTDYLSSEERIEASRDNVRRDQRRSIFNRCPPSV